MRGYLPDNDQVPIHLKAGVNRILVKIVNGASGWGFRRRHPQSEFLSANFTK